jgi:hypothetical protein
MVEATIILFFLNHVLRKTERTSGELKGRTSSIFLSIIAYNPNPAVELPPITMEE